MTRRLAGTVADSGPVLVLAAIAAAGSFTHIRDTADEHGQHGWMAWAIAVCIDLTCVMAARERQRDKRLERETARLSWPTLVLVGGILLSLAANLAQANPTAWGWITAATPAGAFLVAVSMLERRSTRSERTESESAVPSVAMAAPPSFGHHAEPGSSRQKQDGPRPELPAVPATGRQDEQTRLPVPDSTPPSSAGSTPAPQLVAFARRVADEHQTKHGRPITRDTLRARLGVSNQLASDLLRHVRTDTAA
ncbi:DUF2637 domain-containing protein [Actinomadura fulvescens]|uniref:DUF2637 domain-containing protein n=1 Tax=Actinomadura fulvescens TaxID=46160 RepID=A0ABP6CDI2_9ACTN